MSAAPSPALRGTSPTAQAWAALRKNHLAMAGGTVVALVILAAIAAPWLAGEDPHRLRFLAKFLPPLSHSLDMRDANRFVIGQAAETSPAACAAHSQAQVDIAVKNLVTQTVRVQQNAAGVVSMQVGAKPLDTLDLAEPGVTNATLLRGGPGPAKPPVTLVSGQPAPAGFFAPEEKLVVLRVLRPGPPIAWRINLDHGQVQGIELDGKKYDKSEVEIDGEKILSATVTTAGSSRTLTRFHLLGTDEMGRDVLARVLYGARVSLLVGLVATLVSVVIGVIIGAIAGYRGGVVDRWIMAGIDVLYAIPFMFLVILLMAMFVDRQSAQGSDALLLFAALGAVQWLTMARIVRGQVQSLREREFILAATSQGATHSTILFRHLIPNTAGPVIVFATLTVPLVILEESFLAYLGLSVQWEGNVQSWGGLVERGMTYHQQYPWLLICPAVVMAATLLALNALGDGLRDALDVRLRGKA